MQIENGSLRLARILGIDVFVHWSWLVIALLEYQTRDRQRYQAPGWYVAEYLSLFGIVLLHEFGHALACRQVGGTANRIMLWPLGGIAYVSPPPRPGAWLWSIAAGPLVNVALLPITIGAFVAASAVGWEQSLPDAYRYLLTLAAINGVLLVFNLLPLYPLDGGQILQSLLWFVIGRSKSLLVVSVIGLIGGAGLIGLGLVSGDWWLAILAVFLASRCWLGFQQARAMARALEAPRRTGLACPSCGQAPRHGPFWRCGRCGRQFDLFETQGLCPGCGVVVAETECGDCQRRHSLAAYR
jgi:Zn-dependent protease